MSFQLEDALVNAILDAIETHIGTSPHLKIRTGSPPATCATADSGTVLSDIALPSDWLANAASRSKAKTGTWQEAAADATGTAAHFRIYTSGGTCKMQGTVTITGGGGDMTLDSVSITAGQTVTITAFTLGVTNT